MGKEPEFYDSENFFIVYLPNLNYNDEINDQINDQITELGLSIIRMVKSNPGIKADKIYEILSANDNYVEYGKKLNTKRIRQVYRIERLQENGRLLFERQRLPNRRVT